ncbi:MAG TPA: phosphopantothenoylcysteine decarboxylase, partial [Microbacteriaceae bacterium]|nr:phosphopantothenoylcysteine decarboxylase [Microbacteriaceae bacterium]
ELGAEWQLRLVPNPDILAGLSRDRRPGQVIVGFAAESAANAEQLRERASLKRERKGCDILVANRVVPDERGVGAVFGADDNDVVIVRAAAASPGLVATRTVTGDKLSVAHAILDEILDFHAATETTP